jgi:glucose-6-phosphate 1-dehydrogenase
LLRYLDGGSSESATFEAIKQELGSRRRPAHYLAIPPVLFGVAVDHLKPFGTDLQSARSLNTILLRTFDDVRFSESITTFENAASLRSVT